MADFSWPWYYNFPPFFTLQTNCEVRRNQLQSWCGLVIRWSRHFNVTNIDLAGASSLEVFNNSSISRCLSPESISVVLEELNKRGNFDWSDKNKRRGQVLWLSTGEWADKIYSWAQSTSKVNTVCTVYELTQGDETSDQEFYGLSDDVIVKALKFLEKDGKAEIFDAGDGLGVKFLQT